MGQELARLRDAERGRVGAILPDETIKAIVTAARALDPAYGLLIEAAAVAGARRIFLDWIKKDAGPGVIEVNTGNRLEPEYLIKRNRFWSDVGIYNVSRD